MLLLTQILLWIWIYYNGKNCFESLLCFAEVKNDCVEYFLIREMHCFLILSPTKLKESYYYHLNHPKEPLKNQFVCVCVCVCIGMACKNTVFLNVFTDPCERGSFWQHCRLYVKLKTKTQNKKTFQFLVQRTLLSCKRTLSETHPVNTKNVSISINPLNLWLCLCVCVCVRERERERERETMRSSWSMLPAWAFIDPFRFSYLDRS